VRRRTARIATAAIAAVGAVVVWTVAVRLFAHHSLNHDEAVYLQQAAMLLEGQFALRPPVEGQFRPWFFVADGDRLYPKYTPVPAAVFGLGRLLGGYRLALAGVAAGNLALLAGVVREVFDRPAGLLAAAFVLCSPLFVLNSAVFLPYAPTTLFNLAFAYAYLRADRTGDRRVAALAGVAAGGAFFARPYTAVLFAAPFVVHALWTIRTAPREALPRQAVTGALGLAGVAIALGYNAVVTGSPWLFPYEAFAPLDGLGFGRRRILDHGVLYTPELAVRANATVLELFLTEWIAGGPLGAALAGVGLLAVAVRGSDPREAILAGVVVSVVAGNLYFWGNYNVLGDPGRAGDGLISVLGPYYHFDLLVPTAGFAATGAVALGRGAIRGLELRLGVDPRTARAAIGAFLLAGAVAFGAVTAVDFDERIGANAEATATYESAYEPFEDGPPADSVVFLPTPYGDWLNHPFQPLRNDPGFDGRAVYAIDDRPFAVADALPGRRLYRYAYRGPWAPRAGSPEAARLQRVQDVSGRSVRLETTVGVPDGAVGVTARLAAGDGSAYYVAEGVPAAPAIRLTVADGRARLAGDVAAVDDPGVAVDGRETVVITVFVDYGPGGGFSYRLELPVDVSDGRVRALSPRIEHCRNARSCGGAAAYVPGAAPEGVFVRTELAANGSDPAVPAAGAGATDGSTAPNPPRSVRSASTAAAKFRST